MNSAIHTIQELEAQVGAVPAPVNLKVIDHLDEHACRWLAASPLAFAGFSDPQHVHATLAGSLPGFAAALDAKRLRLPCAALDHPELAQPGRGAGLLFLIPGLGETLRINGMIGSLDGSDAIIDVQECYAHCAKALLRSDFWHPSDDDANTSADTASFLAATRFMALATADDALHTDLSPKGDPAGALVHVLDEGIGFADRPGNRRTDSFRNMLSRPHAAAILLVPGSTKVAMLQGKAEISADTELRAAFAVQGKVPKLVTTLRSLDITLVDSPGLARSTPWALSGPPDGIDPAEIFAAHVKLNKTRGLGAALAKGMVAIPGLMRKGLEHDYKRNLY